MQVMHKFVLVLFKNTLMNLYMVIIIIHSEKLLLYQHNCCKIKLNSNWASAHTPFGDLEDQAYFGQVLPPPGPLRPELEGQDPFGMNTKKDNFCLMTPIVKCKAV
jgi:hypothetical protein